MGTVKDEGEEPSAESAEITDGDTGDGEHPTKKFNRSKRFWAIVATLSIVSILSSLENTVVTAALLFIVTQLDLGPRYIWVTNVFFLTGSVDELPCTLITCLTCF
jgi:hypothetical protein